MILDDDDYYNERRREHVRRIRARKFRKAVDLVTNIGLLVGAVTFVILLFAKMQGCQQLSERAAYLEGYNNIDHATAMAFARMEAK